MTSVDIFSDGIGCVEYVSHMGSDVTVVNSARVSFGKHVDKLNKRDIKLIKYLIEHKHTSTLEHCVITLRFKVPLFIRSQHHRHRTWSYNEISRRYTDYNLEFYLPKQFRKQSDSNRQASTDSLVNPMIDDYTACDLVEAHHHVSLELYNSLLDKGVCREQARGVLPQNLYTEYYGTCNLNNLLKFINLRIHDGAQWEIQQVAKGCLEIIKDLYPITVKSFLELKETK